MRGIFLFAAVTTAGATLLPREDLRPWISVDAEGTKTTVTPSRDGDDTFGGSVALPTAAPDGSGSFLLCSPDAGSTGKFQPFCAPQNGAAIDDVDTTVFITWDVDLIENPDRRAMIYAEFSAADGIGGEEGFFTHDFPVSQGYYAWTPTKDLLPERHLTQVQFYLGYTTTSRNETETITDRDPGPMLIIVREDIAPEESEKAKQTRKGLNVAAVVVGVVVGLAVLGVIGAGVWWFGRRKGWFGNKAGYGTRKSREQRARGTNIRLEEGQWSDAGEVRSPGGSNAFRAELRRQEMER